jgi:hypothetical protein
VAETNKTQPWLDQRTIGNTKTVSEESWIELSWQNRLLRKKKCLVDRAVPSRRRCIRERIQND